MKLERSCIFAFALLGTNSLHAATITLSAPDTLGTSSFNVAGQWSNQTAPAPSNDYVVPILRLRTPTEALDYVFVGNSLTLNGPDGNLTYKTNGSQTVTIANLILNGGLIDHLNAFDQVFTLAGNLTVSGTGSRIAATQGPINITAPISGTGDVAINANLGVTFSGVNTHVGNITVNGTFNLGATGTMAFKLGASGLNNTVSGAGIANFNGTFKIDLTGASTTIGDKWSLVNTDTLTETFGPTFAVEGFTGNLGIWTDATGKYQFRQSTGVLSVVSTDSDGDGLPDAWEMTQFKTTIYDGTEDPDGDLASNALEYEFGTNPNLATSFPDTDVDGINDGWELYYFNTLVRDGAADFDGDLASDLLEYKGGSSPLSKASWPDKDSDGMNDGWEMHYFPGKTIESILPGADPDGDLFANIDESLDIFPSDPTDSLSSPDWDYDGLADGWELKYFRVGTESLEAATARHDGTSDPDGDGLSNLLEYKARTNPADAASGNRTLGYWRFEEMPAGELPAGGNGAYAYPNSVTDSSPYGNPMMSWADYSRPNYTAEVPAAIVPATGAANAASLYFLRNGNDIRYFMESIFTSPANLLGAGQGFLRTVRLPEYTVEASFNTQLTGVWQVPVAKFGNPIGGQPPFTLKIDTANNLRAGIVDGSGAAREIIGTTTIAPGAWYSSAVTATATELKLWLKGPAETSYHLEGQITIAGAQYVPAAGPLDSVWTIGGGQWNGVQADPFQGNIDEVRLSAVALAPEQFLFASTSNGSDYSTWAAQRITNANLRAETADADGDGTSNLTEFRLGLDPANGSSRFALAQAGKGAFNWPSAAGLTFRVQRSQTMNSGSWTTLATVSGTAVSTSYADPAPPAGSAFYRVLLEP